MRIRRLLPTRARRWRGSRGKMPPRWPMTPYSVHCGRPVESSIPRFTPRGRVRGPAMAEPFDTLMEVQQHDTTLDQLRHRKKSLSEQAELAIVCLLYTSDAADDLTRVDLGGRRI